VEGELIEDGLAGHGDEGEDVLLALARSLTEQVEASEDSLEGLFAEVRSAEAALEIGLHADDFAPEDKGSERDETYIAADSEPEADTEFDLPLFTAPPTSVNNNGHSSNGDHHELELAGVTQGQQLRLL
jgi:hypothetical protein